MPPILFKDLLVEIRHSLGRFLSITAIVALGVSFFAGIKASSPDMMGSADAYFDKYNMQDIQVYSTLGIDKEDIEALEKVSGVEQVQPVFSMDALAKNGNRELTVKMITFQEDQSMNKPRLVEGRLPSAPDECLLEADSATSKLLGNFQIGDTISLYSGTDTPLSDDFKYTTFTITGKAYNPNYLSYEKGSSAIGSGSVDTFVYVLQSALKADYFTEADVTVQSASDLNTYDDAYFDTVEPVVDKIETLADKQVQSRVDEMQDKVDEARKEMDEKLADGQKQLDDGKKKLEDGQKEIDSGQKEVSDGKAQLESGKKELADSQAALADAKAQLDSGWASYYSGRQQLEDGLSQVNAGIAQIQTEMARLPQLKEQKAQLESAIAGLDTIDQSLAQAQSLQDSLTQTQAAIDAFQQQYPEVPLPEELQQALTQLQQGIAQMAAGVTGSPDSSIEEVIAALQASKAAIESQIGSREAASQNLQALDAGIAQLEGLSSQLAQLQQTQSELYAKQSQLAASLQTLQASQAQYESGVAQAASAQTQLDQAQSELTSAQAKLDQAKTDLEKGQAEYEDSVKTFEEEKKKGEQELADAQQKIDDLDPKWIVLDRNSHYSYRDYEACADRMDGISSVFPVFFFLVAALVCMTTMTRMVDEQRGNLGTLKALGYSKGQIAMKYLLYAGLASVLGSAIGCAVGMVTFPYVIFTAWNTMYNLESIHFSFPLDLILLSSLSVIAVVLLATVLSIYKELLEVPAQLMRPKAIRAGSKILLERIPWLWNKFSFMHKVTLRNLFRYKKRFFMTVIGIAGCSALLVSGFGLNDSISDIVDSQYSRIYHYNAAVTAKAGTGKETAAALEKLDGVSQACDLESLAVTVNYDGKDVSAALNIVDNPKDFETFMTFFGMEGSPENLQLDDSGVLLSIKTAEKLGVKPGDEMTFKTSDEQSVKVPVAGVFEQYVGHEIYMSRKYFDSLHLDLEPEATILLVNDSTDSDFESALGADIMDNDNVKSVTFYSAMAQNFLDMIASIKIVVLVLVMSAAMLAFVVLYNLSNVNISERVREIATIKVLGFTEKEVNEYVNRESLLLALIGGAAGLLLGIWLHGMIMNLAEMDTIRFGRTILWQSFVLSLALTMVFALAVNWIMKFQLRRIEMVESLKAVE